MLLNAGTVHNIYSINIMDQLAVEFIDPKTSEGRRRDILELLSLRQYPGWIRTLENVVKEQQKLSKEVIYTYMLTFTTDPSKWPEISPERESMIEDLVRQQGLRTGLGIKKYSYVKERHANGRAHFHSLIQTTKPLKKDRFTHYISRYGNIDISKSKAQQDANVINYMSKENDIIYVYPHTP